MEFSLRIFWDDVQVMSDQNVEECISTFIHECVKNEFANKFKKELDSNKPITKRFFYQYRIINLSQMISDTFINKRIKQLSLWVVWGSYESSYGYFLKGENNTIDKIFVTEGDSIAKITSGNEIVYLFLDGHRGELYSFHR